MDTIRPRSYSLHADFTTDNNITQVVDQVAGVQVVDQAAGAQVVDQVAWSSGSGESSGGNSGGGSLPVTYHVRLMDLRDPTIVLPE